MTLQRPGWVRRRCRVLDADPEKNRARFECGKCSHTWRGRMLKKDPLGQEPSAWAIKFFARYWADGANMYCPKCSKIKGATQ